MAHELVDLIVLDGRIWTQDPDRPWAQALAVADGRITAVGSSADMQALAGPRTQVHRLDGATVIPGLVDAHVHLHLGGAQAAFEMPVLPTDDVAAIAGRVRDWATALEPRAWVVGGIVGSTVMDALTHDDLATLDAAAAGHPVLLRDDSMHNRWVSSRAMELIGISGGSPDPDGGRYVRDAQGRLTGVLHESASGQAERAFAASLDRRRCPRTR